MTLNAITLGVSSHNLNQQCERIKKQTNPFGWIGYFNLSTRQQEFWKSDDRSRDIELFLGKSSCFGESLSVILTIESVVQEATSTRKQLQQRVKKYNFSKYSITTKHILYIYINVLDYAEFDFELIYYENAHLKARISKPTKKSYIFKRDKLPKGK